MDLSKYVKGYDKKSYVYDLYGICNHGGNTWGGHYTAYVKNADNNWESGLLLESNSGNKGWNFHTETTGELLVGYNSNPGTSLAGQAASEIIQLNDNNLTASRPILSKMNNGVTDNNCKHYTHVASADLYGSGTGYTIIDTNIPHYDASNANNMFQIS